MRGAFVRDWLIALVVLAQSAPLVAQETRSLPVAQRVPFHSSVEVSALPPARAAGNAEPARVKVQPRRRPDPEGLQQLKDALVEAPRERLAIPETIEDPAPPAAAASSPLSVISAFEGLANLPDNAPFSPIPSDANLAVGPNHVFEMVNNVGRITDKSGAAASTFTLHSFFQVDNGFGETDPRVIYDAASNRWFATYAQFLDPKLQSSLILAVSTTSDPTKTFCLFRLGNPNSEGFIQDFPQLGISDDKVIVTYNGFSFVGESFLGAGYYVINKADLVNAGSVGCQSESVRRVRVPPNVARYGVYPAQSLSSTGSLYMVMNGNGGSGSSVLVLVVVSGEPGVTGVTEDATVFPINSWHPPPNAVQAGSTVKLNTGDASVISAVWQRDSLWLGGNEQCIPSGDTVPRSCLRVIQIRTNLLGVQQDITFGSPGQDHYYPALSPDGAGNLVVVLNASSASDFAGVRVTGRLATDPPNTLIASTLLRAGGGAQTHSSGRMGDYHGAAMDPADPSKVWVTAEYIRATESRDWSTYVAQLMFTTGSPPTLAVALNTHTFRAGDALQVTRTVGNPGGALLVDVYFGALLPPAAGPALGCPLGDAIAFIDALSKIVIRCLSGSPAGFPVFASASIPAGQPPTTVPNFFDFAWPSAPAGPYTVFMVFTVPGSLADASIGPSDIVVIASDTLTFSP
jgi:hypothetical protein